ncbi:MAG: ABC transporter ATP-binding protein [Paracoccaceae bacterium]
MTDDARRPLFDRLLHPVERLVDPYAGGTAGEALPNRLVPFVLHFLRPTRWVILGGLAIGFVGALTEAALVAFSAQLIDMLTNTEPTRLWAEHSSTLVFMIVVALVIAPLTRVAYAVLMGQGFYPVNGALIRWRTHRKMLRQSTGFFADDFAGRIANKQIQLAPAIGDSVYHVTDAIWFVAVFTVGSALVLADADWRLLIPLGAWVGAVALVATWFIPRVVAVGKDVAEARSTLAGRVVDAYANIQTAKLFAHAEREEAYAREALEEFRWTFARQTRLYTRLECAMSALHVLLYGGVVGYAVYLWSAGAVTPGIVAAAFAIALRMSGLVDWIMQTVSMLFQNVGTVQEGMETIAQPLRLPDAPGAAPLRLTEGAIRFEDVHHHYGRGSGGVRGITLDVAGGERVGLVGRSGAGKSTLVNLCLRFFDPEEGRVLIDGQDLRDLEQESVRRQIAMVTQDTALLHRSIRDNIRYGRPEATDAEVWMAARKVAANEFIADLADRDGRSGLDAEVGERGVKLSGGQRQRIALARAVLKDAPILILDEATSALDSEVEAAIQDSLADLMKGRTVIAIAHRLSTIAQMDRIVVLDEGRVVEEGTHDDLLAAGGLYARLWARQSGGFIDAGAEAETAA